MKKYKVIFHLMVDPIKGDHTFRKSYKVEASSPSEAYSAAESLLDKEPPDIRQRSIFNYEVIEAN